MVVHNLAGMYVFMTFPIPSYSNFNQRRVNHLCHVSHITCCMPLLSNIILSHVMCTCTYISYVMYRTRIYRINVCIYTNANHVPSVKYHVVNHLIYAYMTCMYIPFNIPMMCYRVTVLPSAVWQVQKSLQIFHHGPHWSVLESNPGRDPTDVDHPRCKVFGPGVVDGWLDAKSAELV